eukprot:1146291-Pelagomonas_calceolata.AAC.2
MAAATIACLLEGPAQRGFLAVAEARTMASASARAAPARGFLTLSASLGQMVVCLHAGWKSPRMCKGHQWGVGGNSNVLQLFCVSYTRRHAEHSHTRAHTHTPITP